MAILSRAAGDIIAVPALKDGHWGFLMSRVIYADVVTCIEVFAPFKTNFVITANETLEQIPSIQERLFNPIYASFDFSKNFGKIKWPILAHDLNYDTRQSRASDIEFEGDCYNELGYFLRGRKEFTEPSGVRRVLENRTIYSNPQLVHRINLYFSGVLKKGEVCNAARVRALIEERGMSWWADGVEACRESVDAVAKKFADSHPRKRVAKKRS